MLVGLDNPLLPINQSLKSVCGRFNSTVDGDGNTPHCHCILYFNFMLLKQDSMVDGIMHC